MPEATTTSQTNPPSTSKPTILLIHGSWHTPAHMKPFMQHLTAAGFPSSCPAQATTLASPTTGLAQDTQVTRSELIRLIDQESRDVIVIGHSYGCVVMTQSVTEEFSKSKRQREGKKGGVTNLLYMCGFLVDIGQSIASTFDNHLPPWILVDEKGMVRPENPGHVFYHDIPEEQQKYWASKLVVNHGGTQFDTVTHAAYLYHPVTYLYCENDQALPLQYQKIMVKNVSEKKGITIVEESCSASHSPFLSMPQVLVELLQRMSSAS